MRIGRSTPGNGIRLGFYDWGATPFYALQSEPRLSYCLYVPRGYDEEGGDAYPLIALMHGTERGAHLYRDWFADLAEAEGAIVLAPLFPCNLAGQGDTENYKFLEAAGIRFDLALLDMVEEVARRYRIRGERFLLHGFSGGGHFTHRFLFLHPHRLLAASIGAPGVVTLLDGDVAWPVGTGGMGEAFGAIVDRGAIAAVPVQCVVGAADTETWEITVPETAPIWRPGINETGRTRIDRLRRLAGTLTDAGCRVRFDLVPGAGHDGQAVLGPVFDFVRDVIRRGETAA